MTCRELVELVTSYLEGVMPDAERAAFDEHITLCAGCERYLEQLRVTIALLGELAQETLTEPTRRELLDAFSTWRSRPGPST
jgi:anti-sigma factor RsiW